MKHRLLFFSFILFIFSAVNGASRKPKKTSANSPEPTIVYVPVPVENRLDPIEEDKKLDQKLFGHFIKILGNFGKILVDPHDKMNVTSNATQMINGVISVAQELLKRNISPGMREKMIFGLIRHVQRNRTVHFI